MHTINCGNCHGTHGTAREVHACYFFKQPEPQPKHWRDQPATDKQKRKIRDLGGLVVAGMTKGEASDKIETLLRIPRNQPGYVRPSTRPMAASSINTFDDPGLTTPLPMIETLRDGRYAMRPDENTPFMFLKIWRPKSGRKKGCLVISTQHSDAYKECIVRWPSGKWSVYDRKPDRNLIYVVADPVTAARNYAREKDCCCRCGRELTDGRSIWYGIGPECEEHWPEIINLRDEEAGRPYQPGDVPSDRKKQRG